MRYVVAVDGSPASDRALDHAVETTTAADADLTIVHAVEPAVRAARASEPIADLSDAEGTLVVESEDDAEEHAARLLDAAAGRAAEAGVDAETELLYGDPVTEIPDFAADEGYDAIFVGHRGLSEAQERVLGSVAKAMVERSSLPVTVVG